MLLKEILEDGKKCELKIFLYEPILSLLELEACKKFQIEGFSEEANLDWKFEGNENEKTLFFMPHCEIELYESFLKANWEKRKLEKMILVGNSLESYALRNSEEKMKKKYVCVFHLSKLCSEIPLSNSDFIVDNIFNDISVHSFSFSLKSLPDFN